MDISNTVRLAQEAERKGDHGYASQLLGSLLSEPLTEAERDEIIRARWTQREMRLRQL